jgi:hypothetical protein
MVKVNDSIKGGAVGSRKKSSWMRAKREFLDACNGSDDIFANERRRHQADETAREEAFVIKSCQSKNRYTTEQEARAVAQDCMAKGSAKLSVYKCDKCKGWHLTSHPWE